MSVIVASELDQLVAARSASGETNSRHGGLGATRNEAKHFEAVDPAAHFFGHQYFAFGRRSVAGSVTGSDRDGVDDGRVRMTKDARAIAQYVIDVAFAFDIPDIGTFGLVDEVRRAAN